MIRKIVHINEEKCNGCGACAKACHEGAIKMIKGKAQLLRDDYCDGLGDCLPACPTGAITFEEREAAPYDHAAVLANQTIKPPSSLHHWPVQIKLSPLQAPFLKNAELLIAADCTAYAYAKFHEDFMHNRVVLIGCPKLDVINYSEKLSKIIRLNEIRSITVIRMEVPCCGGIEHAVKEALKNSEKHLPWQVITISTDGEIVN